MAGRIGALCLAAAAIGPAACSYRPSVTHPKMAPPTTSEMTLPCDQVDLAIDRADTVRWVIRDDGGKLESSGEKAGRYTANAFLVPLSILAMTPNAIPDSGQSALAAVDLRVFKLLQLKRDRNCPARPTSVAGLDDRALTAELEALLARIDGEGRSRMLLDEWTRLLDGLRVVAPAASTGQSLSLFGEVDRPAE
jgi:hypothetical protein